MKLTIPRATQIAAKALKHSQSDGIWNFWRKTDGTWHKEYHCGIGHNFSAELYEGKVVAISVDGGDWEPPIFGRSKLSDGARADGEAVPRCYTPSNRS